MCLVEDDQVPVPALLQLELKVLVPGQFVETGDEQVIVVERVPRPR